MAEVVRTKNKSVECEGGEPPYGHPLVYLEIKDESGKIVCPYCSKEFVLDK